MEDGHFQTKRSYIGAGTIEEPGYIILRNSITEYESYILTAIWEENPNAIEGWTLKVEGKDVRIKATVATDKQQYQQGETVKIIGTVNNVANTEVEIYVMGDGVSQTITTHTDASGTFATEWTPYSGLMGRFTIGVSYQGKELTEQPAQVDIIGLRRTSNSYITCEAVVGDPFTGEIEVVNPWRGSACKRCRDTCHARQLRGDDGAARHHRCRPEGFREIHPDGQRPHGGAGLGTGTASDDHQGRSHARSDALLLLPLAEDRAGLQRQPDKHDGVQGYGERLFLRHQQRGKGRDGQDRALNA